jgi:hypothetical protein
MYKKYTKYLNPILRISMIKFNISRLKLMVITAV